MHSGKQGSIRKYSKKERQKCIGLVENWAMCK